MLFRFLIFFCLFISCFYSQKNGLIKTYYYGSKLQSEIFYINDVIDGAAKYYYINGRVKRIEEYNQGKLDGWVKEYYENGSRKAEFYVKEGVLDGYARYYYDNNELQSIKKYERGVLIESSEFLYDSSVVFQPPPLESEKNIVKVLDLSKNKNVASVKKKENKQLSPPKPAYSENEEFYYFVVDQPAELIGGVKKLIDKIVIPDTLIVEDFRSELTFRLYINEKGELKDIEIVKGGPDYLVKAAIEQIKKSSFKPAALKNQNVKSQLLLSLPFHISVPKK